MTNPESKAAAPWTLCKNCGQPIKPGRHKPHEYRHAQGCPSDRSTFARATRAAAILGRKGGLSRSAEKVRAAKENGKKGGAPPKFIYHSLVNCDDWCTYDECACECHAKLKAARAKS